MSIPRDVLIVGDEKAAQRFIEEFRRGIPLALYFIASTKTSIIPGISIAGPSPEGTLYTPALDVEYLVAGRPLTLNVIPMTPEGLPTPALLTRVALSMLSIPYMVVDAGSYIEPRIPHVDLPSRRVGERIDTGKALLVEVARALFEESRILAEMVVPSGGSVIVGESIPGGTTTAMAIMEALGFRAIGKVSSAGPNNPHELKKRVFEEGIKNSGLAIPTSNVFEAVAAIGDPLHISIAGFVVGALSRNSRILLAGGTQMCAVLAILKKFGIELRERVAIGTTRWTVKDPSSDIEGLVRDIAPEVPIIATALNLGDAPFPGLRMYEQGFVKEGVGAGGTIVALTLLRGVELDELKKAIYNEYQRLLQIGAAKGIDARS